MNEYRINVRFSLKDDRQRETAEFLKHLDRERYGSRNSFAVAAICSYVERLNCGGQAELSLESIRQLFREEMQGLSVSANDAPTPRALITDLTVEQQEENARNVLAALEAF